MATDQERLADFNKIIDARLAALGVRQPYVTSIDSAYSGGAPKTKDGGDSAAPDATDLVFAAYATCNIRPSDQAVKTPLAGGGFGINGRLMQPTPGLLGENKYWIALLPFVTGTTSSTSITARAQRMELCHSLLVASVHFTLTGGTGGATARVKLFSSDNGATLIIDTGDLAATGAGPVNHTLSTSVQLIPGTYIVEVTASSASVLWRCADLPSTFAATMNQGVTQRATSAAMSSATTAVEFPIVKFQQ